MAAEDANAGTVMPEAVMELATSDDPRAVARALREQPVMRIADLFSLVTRRPTSRTPCGKSAVFSLERGAAWTSGNIRPLIPLRSTRPST